jgi:uncharacterized protein YbaR (Trm112 family)
VIYSLRRLPGVFMSESDGLPIIACPNCQQPMQTQDFPGHDQAAVRVELCFACAGIWFDHLASVQLAPAAVIELFKEIQSHRNTAPQPVAKRLSCPRCKGDLSLSFDLSKSGRFSYYSCPGGDGRFTPFFQFLREKQFVRSLTAGEVQRLRTQVRQINCSECGAPIDLEHSTQCEYCHAPVSFLDPDAVEKALHMWSEAENRRHAGPAPQVVADALSRIQLPHGQPNVAPGVHLGSSLPSGGSAAPGSGSDLVAAGIHALGRLFERGE